MAAVKLESALCRQDPMFWSDPEPKEKGHEREDKRRALKL